MESIDWLYGIKKLTLFSGIIVFQNIWKNIKIKSNDFRQKVVKI